MVGMARDPETVVAGEESGAVSAAGFAFLVAPGPSPLATLLDVSVRDDAPAGTIAEVSPAAVSLMHAIAARLERRQGAALVIDYGYDRGSHGDTLQAVHRHAKSAVFDRIGDSDLTAHVDFAVLARTAREAGAAVDGPVGQGDFLRALGIASRARALLARATAAQVEDIDTAMDRLIAPERMGNLFRVLAIRNPAMTPAPGFAQTGRADDPNRDPGPES
jgi:NADH dehydrogenase [ubiquinone] 1 alpha subcomplex assembly factor 7